MKILVAVLVLLIGCSLGFLYWAHLPRNDDTSYTINGLHPPKTTASRIRLITYNIAYGRGLEDDILTGRRKEDLIKENLKGIGRLLKDNDADIAFIQEVDIASRRTHFIDEVAFLAEVAGYPSYACVTNWVKNYVPYPYWPPSKHFGRMKSGQCILSKFPIVSNERIGLPPRGDKPFFYTAFELTRAIQITEVLIDGELYRLFNLHQEAFDMKNREEQAQILARMVNEGNPERTIVAGDFNALPPDAVMTKNFPQRPDMKHWKELDDVSNDRSMEIFISSTPGFSGVVKGFTFPSDVPDKQIDYVFISKDLKAAQGRVLKDAGVLSDHLPIYVELELSPKP